MGVRDYFKGGLASIVDSSLLLDSAVQVEPVV